MSPGGLPELEARIDVLEARAAAWDALLADLSVHTGTLDELVARLRAFAANQRMRQL